MTTMFAPSRSDGRSDRMVVFDLARDAEPDTMFTYDALLEALSEGLDTQVTQGRIYRAVSAGNETLLEERKRYLRVVPGKGYRVIHTSEAVSVALTKKGRAETYLKKGMKVLLNADLNELTPAQRTIHEGQMMVFAAFGTAIRESERRHAKSDQLIAELTRRVERLEDDTGTGE